MIGKSTTCPICGGTKRAGKTTFTVDLGFGVIVVRDVPALVCVQCGADWIDDAVASRLETLVNESRQQQRQVEVTAYQSV
ncbi:MAG: type II toxin-antitoxin system MqsA family antitoxin [Anaerolineales bacterium]|nr:type II toxin-antitoxin system MqsA family antitoxin [Chloroflexota bacterium]MDO9128325.1 type II toxin-antitoxin system MqsA family antitoxin [Anaerolineales bacterium]